MQSGLKIAENLRTVRERIAESCHCAGRDPSEVTLVAVTKTVDVPAIRQLYELGERDFGESRPQTLWKKAPQLPDDVRWHLIGHLQTNKVRRTIACCHCVHSVDRTPLAEEISSAAKATGVHVRIALQVNLTQEEQKHGYSPEELLDQYDSLMELPGLHAVGLMAMARQEEDPEQCRATFASLRRLRDQLQDRRPDVPLPMLSMGMSQDYPIAIEEGATHVRVGSALFEE